MAVTDYQKLYTFEYIIDHTAEEVLSDTAENIVLKDTNLLEIGLGDNPDLNNVIEDLTFDATGYYGSLITWDASAHSQITDSGVVTRGVGNVTANIIAIIRKQNEFDTKIFSVIVLAA